MSRPDLPVVDPPAETACCSACAQHEATDEPANAPLLIPLAPAAARPLPIRRDADRRIALVSVATAGAFVAAAIASALAGSGWWLPLHLVLAGAASTAIAGVLPFFASALAAAPPASPPIRAGAVLLVAGGALGVASRSLGASGTIVSLAGVAFVVGLALVLAMTVSAARAGLAARRPVVAVAYFAALGNVLAGASIATLFVAGHPAVVGAWATLRPAHVWLNLVGFVSLVVAGTLLHLLPTVAGTRIADRPTGRVAVGGLAAGPPLVALGLAVAGTAGPSPAADGLARVGALLTLTAGGALALEAVAVLRARGRWTTDAAWHAASTGSLAAAVGWFAIGLAVAAGNVLTNGASEGAWSTPLVAAPLAVGWVVQAVVGSWTHLVPAIGPGGPGRHADRRSLLGRFAVGRLVARNVGVALLSVGLAIGHPAATTVGAALAGSALILDLALLAAALVRRSPSIRAAPLRPAA